jgi:glycosyltransferase involved in cell wall biosynthesis
MHLATTERRSTDVASGPPEEALEGLRVLFVCTSLKTGGAERQWLTLIPGLKGLGIDSCVLALRAEGPVADALRASDIKVAAAAIRHRFDVARILATVRDTGYGCQDVIVTRSIDAHVIGAAIARRLRAAHVATEHTHYDLLPLRRHQRLLYRLVAPHIDAAVAVSGTQLPLLEALGYRRHVLTVIPNGIVPPSVSRTRESVRRSLGLSNDDVVFTAIASLRPEKRLDIFVNAVARAHQADPRIRGLVVGGGPEYEHLHRLCASTAGSVLLLGERSDIGDLLIASDAGCLTSAHEALPLSLLEAASHALPLVATDVGGTSEVVKTDETGYLVGEATVEAVRDALLSISADPTHAATLGERAQATQASTFSADAMIARYARLLRAVACEPVTISS